MLDSARIDLRLDSTYAFVQLHRAPHSGIHGVVTDSVNDSGTYSFCGTQIILTSSSAGHAQHQGAATASYFSLAVDSTLLAGSYLNYGFAVFASDLHQNVCGVEPPLTPPQASGEFGLRTLDGDSLPVTLIETDKTTVSISSAVFVMHAPRYSVQAIGKTSRSGDSTVVVVADSGEVQTCGGAMKLATSMVRDTAFLIESRDTLIAMPLAPDFVGYMYSQTYFAYLDPPMKLIFTPNR